MAERVNPFLAMANKNNERNSQDLKENPESPIKYGDEVAEVKITEKKVEEPKPEKTEAKKEEAVKKTVKAEPKKQEKKSKAKSTASQGELVEDGINYKVDLKSENIKRKGVDLLKDNDAYLATRSRELGMKIQDYFSLLILEDTERINRNGIDLDEELVVEASTTGKETSRRTVVMEEKTFISIKRNAAKSVMKETQYLNYLILAERKNEENNGLRKGLYD